MFAAPPMTQAVRASRSAFSGRFASTAEDVALSSETTDARKSLARCFGVVGPKRAATAGAGRLLGAEPLDGDCDLAALDRDLPPQRIRHLIPADRLGLGGRSGLIPDA
jgi:hypothetical protein